MTSHKKPYTLSLDAITRALAHPITGVPLQKLLDESSGEVAVVFKGSNALPWFVSNQIVQSRVGSTNVLQDLMDDQRIAIHKAPTSFHDPSSVFYKFLEEEKIDIHFNDVGTRISSSSHSNHGEITNDTRTMRSIDFSQRDQPPQERFPPKIDFISTKPTGHLHVTSKATLAEAQQLLALSVAPTIRKKQACDCCRSQHLKCNGASPCQQCIRRVISEKCTYTAPQKRGPKSKVLRENLDRLSCELERCKAVIQQYELLTNIPSSHIFAQFAQAPNDEF